jgi:hypothetical protein
MKELKIHRDDKKFLDPEAQMGSVTATNGVGGERRFLCIQSASEMLFAHWIQITPFRNPVLWVKTSIAKRKAFGGSK